MKEAGSLNHHMESVRDTHLGLCMNEHWTSIVSESVHRFRGLFAMTTESTLPSLCVWLPHRSTRLRLAVGGSGRRDL